MSLIWMRNVFSVGSCIRTHGPIWKRLGKAMEPSGGGNLMTEECDLGDFYSLVLGSSLFLLPALAACGHASSDVLDSVL